MTPADLLELGLKLFPVTPHKRPAMMGWQRYATLAKIENIRNDYRNGYRAFGIYLKPSGLVVFDADNEQADQWAEDHLPDTPMMTITKRGSHRYYRLPEGCPVPTDNRPVVGVSLDRKAKGYVVAPGSTLGGFVYREKSFWDTPLSELPLYPVHMFPERPVVKCEVTVPDTKLDKTGIAIQQWFISNSEDSVMGDGGSSKLKRAASFFVNGMALDLNDACRCMEEWNIHKAKPMWSAREILHALETSIREGSKNGRPRGWAYTDWAG